MIAAQTLPHSVTLNWTWAQGSGGTVTGFNVLRSTTTGTGYTTIGTTPLATTSFTDSSATGNVLVEGTTYYYVVQAAGPGGTSPNSNEAVAVIPFLPPAKPDSLSAVPH